MLKRFILHLLFLTLFIGNLSAATADKIGIGLLHGKWGDPSRNISKLAASMKSRGFVVITPLMPWSREREYDIAYPAAMGILDDAVRELHRKGASVVVMAGHSMGANASIAYAAYGHEKIDAVIAIAPGHTPDRPKYHQNIESSLNEASEMIKAGRGREKATFGDLNSGGRSAGINMSAEAYLSYNDPLGMASMPISTSKVTQHIPLFWIVAGPEDVLYSAGKAYVYDRWPQHPLSRYLVLNSTHLNAPDDAENDILQWLDALSPANTETNRK
jgi:acetyl esterase/lipase